MKSEKSEKWFFGVCAKIADHLAIDPIFIRLGFIFAGLIVGFTVPVILYAVCAFLGLIKEEI
jgi:phage shock protein PspC (stress-responsive transcriptional regulator)